MLCTPPAFILSQDQTLDIIVSKQPKLIQSVYIELLLLAILLFVWVVFSFELFEIQYTYYFFSFVLLSCCSIFNDRVPQLAQRLWYYTTSKSSCQYLLQKFFYFFDIFLQFFDGIVTFWATFDIIALTFPFVNSFFEKNSTFFNFFLFVLFLAFFEFWLDFYSPKDYNIGSEIEEMRNRYGDCI